MGAPKLLGGHVRNTRPGIVYRPVIDLALCQLAVAWRRGDRREAVRELVSVATEVTARIDAQAVQAS